MYIFIMILQTIITMTVIVLSWLERKDLVDRLMSKNIVEYKSLKEEPNNLGEDDGLISIEEAREDFLNEEK